MSGKFYSVGVGPGDPECITLKAVRTIKNADIIAIPVKKHGEKSTAFDIVKRAVDVSGKRIEEIEFLMSSDRNVRLESRRKGIEKIAAMLDEGNTVAMVTLGDVSIYSTCTYINKKIKELGYKSEIVSGIPSFCAAAAGAAVSLCEENETLAIIPAITMEVNLEGIIRMFDNVVIMKAGKNINEIYNCLKKLNMAEKAIVTSCVGMENEVIEPIKENGNYGYFTTVIVKKN